MDFATRFGDKVTQCEIIIGYVFMKKTLCGEALNAAGGSFYTLGGAPRPMPKNDRLAVYGDAVAESYLCRLWYEGGSEKVNWTTIRGGALGNDSLAQVGSDHGLHECIVVNDGTATVSTKMMATALEAILGAVRRDGGVEALARVMSRLGLAQHPLLSTDYAVN